MTESKRASRRTSKIGSDLAKVDAHVVTAEELDEIPELTEEWIASADMHEGGKLVRRGRPKAEKTKVPVKLRLDEDVVQSFKDEGPGWQTRMNEVLKLSKSGTRFFDVLSRRQAPKPAGRIVQESPIKLVAYRGNSVVAVAVLHPKDKTWIVSYERSSNGGRVIATSPLKKFAIMLLERAAGIHSSSKTVVMHPVAVARSRAPKGTH